MALLSSKSVPWWNTECKVAIRNAKQAFNRYKKEEMMIVELTTRELELLPAEL